MYQKERIDSIKDILQRNGYVTVKYLVDTLHYSNATINRDLNIMEKQKMITRSYGGAELAEPTCVPLEFRYNKMKTVKREIAKFASDIICDGDTVFIDGSTTSEGIGAFITNKKNITVITNNMALVAHLSEYGIHTICTGGYIIEAPHMLGGEDAVRTAMKYKTDKLFFSSGAFSNDGSIGTTGSSYSLIFEAALKNTKKAYYLTDHSKFDSPMKYILTDFSTISAVISDYSFPEEVKIKYANTSFYELH